MKNLIRKILKESLESKWNLGNEFGNKYDYQHGYCHYFAYNIIGKLRKLYPTKNINYYLILGDEIYDFDEGELENTTLVHAYIKIDDMYLDSNGISSLADVEKRMNDWYDENMDKLPEDYRLEMYHKEVKSIPKYYFNSDFCNVSIVKRDIERFLSHPEVRDLLQIIK
jgi:hypothetical protein